MNNRAGTLLEKSSPRTPLRNLLMIFGTWELHSQAPKMTERFLRECEEKSFLEELTQLCTKYIVENPNLAYYYLLILYPKGAWVGESP